MASLTRKAPKKRVRTQRGVDEKYTGPKPNWEGCDTWSVSQFWREWMRSCFYWNYFYSGKDLKQDLFQWMKNAGYSREDISAVRRIPDSHYQITVTGLAKNLNEGMIPMHPEEQEYIDSKPGLTGTAINREEHLREQVDRLVQQGHKIKEPEEAAAKTKPNIQDRLRDAASEKTAHLDQIVDNFLIDPRKNPLKKENVLNLFRREDINVAHARVIRKWYEKETDDLQLLITPPSKLKKTEKDDHQDLAEAYGFLTKPQQKELAQFYMSIRQACDVIETEKKLTRKPRKKKEKSATQLVKSLKFKPSDSEYGIASIDPVKLIGATVAVVFNTKNRKLGIYIAEDARGFSAKGTSITQFDEEKSLMKTVRKPAEVLPNLVKTTKRKAGKVFDELNAKESPLNGRMNEHIVILHVFK